MRVSIMMILILLENKQGLLVILTSDKKQPPCYSSHFAVARTRRRYLEHFEQKRKVER